ncbi:MAG: (Dimethylallyl)adenosine tRNA methylthiotransferase MiaB [Syntrophorhabdus sp. PtaU1.Bin153]|nr:MAG: (Dimethylallyl)adenosine tRNA methylthiotransferase MiaB [Syntrophorhabdus sp. PtaU1.Bin153]
MPGAGGLRGVFVKPQKALLINPYIYDFAAYSFWSSPLGLLYMGSVLRRNGFQIGLVDCMEVVEEKRKADGRAPFVKEKVETVSGSGQVARRLKRYGISPESLVEKLSHMEPPDLILITSIMTYWYRGTHEVLGIARKIFPRAKIVLGGIYPSLCYEHALQRMTDADLIVSNKEVDRFYRFVEDSTGSTLPYKPDLHDLDGLPYPCYDLLDAIPFVPLLTSYGCIYHCTYCATPYMYPGVVRRKADSVIEEISYWHDRGVERYVIYDDNFLYRGDLYAQPLLRAIADFPFSVSIYNPNAVNAALIDEETARLLFEAGFREIRMGFESADPAIQKATGGKVTSRIFESALSALFKGGFTNDMVGVYVLAGLPGQNWEDVKRSIDYLAGLGIKAHIAEYTPIPHTPLFEQFQTMARYPIAQDPFYQNNALFPFAWEGFTERDLAFLKHYARAIKAKPG